MKASILTSVHTVWDTRIYHRQALSLAEAGYQVTIIATQNNDSGQTSLESVNATYIHRPKWRFGRVVNWFHFIRLALKSRADIYHFHDPDLLFVGLVIKWLTGLPVIYDCHEPYREAIEEKAWIPKPIRSLVGALYDRIEQFFSRFMSAVIIANPSQQNHFPQAVLVANFPKLNPFDLDTEPDYNSAQLVYLGQLSQARGIIDLIEAHRLLEGNRPKIVLMGHFADEDTRLALERLTKKHNLGDTVQYLGVVAYDRGIEVLTQSSIGVIPFRAMPALRLAIPTKMFEYMACGLPVVASDLLPIAPYIQDADCGLVVPPQNPQAFAKAIGYLLSHPEEARRMGENGRRAVIEKYSWNSEAKKLLELYESLLKT